MSDPIKPKAGTGPMKPAVMPGKGGIKPAVIGKGELHGVVPKGGKLDADGRKGGVDVDGAIDAAGKAGGAKTAVGFPKVDPEELFAARKPNADAAALMGRIEQLMAAHRLGKPKPKPIKSRTRARIQVGGAGGVPTLGRGVASKPGTGKLGEGGKADKPGTGKLGEDVKAEMPAKAQPKDEPSTQIYTGKPAEPPASKGEKRGHFGIKQKRYDQARTVLRVRKLYVAVRDANRLNKLRKAGNLTRAGYVAKYGRTSKFGKVMGAANIAMAGYDAYGRVQALRKWDSLSDRERVMHIAYLTGDVCDIAGTVAPPPAGPALRAAGAGCMLVGMGAEHYPAIAKQGKKTYKAGKKAYKYTRLGIKIGVKAIKSKEGKKIRKAIGKGAKRGAKKVGKSISGGAKKVGKSIGKAFSGF